MALRKDKDLILQQYYGNAICEHAGNLDGMVEACWAVYYHSISTDDNPQYHCCPKGVTSWCFYQRAKALSQEVPHHKDLKDNKKVASLSIGTMSNQFSSDFVIVVCWKDVLWVPHRIKMRSSTVLFGSAVRRLTSLRQLPWNWV